MIAHPHCLPLPTPPPCCSLATAGPGTAEWQLGISDAAHQCWLVNTWCLLMLVVALPLLLAWRLERAARWRFYLRQAAPQEDAAAAEQEAVPADSLPTHSLGSGATANDAAAADDAAAGLAAGAGAGGAAAHPFGGSLEWSGATSSDDDDSLLSCPSSWVVGWEASWELAASTRPTWAWLLDACLVSCAAWACLTLIASRDSPDLLPLASLWQ